MNILVASHGKYALETKRSVEMIVGEQPDLQVVTFEMDMSVETLMAEYRKKLAGWEREEVIVLVDIIGGTPANAAMLLQADYQKLTIYAGLSMTLLLSLILNGQIETAITDSLASTKELIL